MCKPDNYANKIANDSTLTRMANDRVRIAEWNGDLERSADLLKDFSASSPDTNEQSLHTAELITKLALMNGSYERAESTSRYLVPNIESLSDAMPKLGWQTPRDKFLKAHEEALLDRAIALWHLRRYDEAENSFDTFLRSASNLATLSRLMQLHYWHCAIATPDIKD